VRKLLFRCDLAPGDIVMLTAAVRDLHRCYPRQFLTGVQTRCPDLWLNNPYITEFAADEDVQELICSYPLIDFSNRTPHHCLHGFIKFLNAKLGLTIEPTEFHGDIHLSAQEKAWYSQVHEVTGEDTPFWIVAAGGKYDVTIKWWATERFQKVVDHFRGRIQFVQIGDEGHHHPKLDGVIDLRGKTNLRELVRLIYHSQGVLCPVTSSMHLAAAVPVKSRQPTRPCVVIAGGREPAHWEAYPNHQFLHTNGALKCCKHGGCWKDRTLALRDGDRRDRPENLCTDVVGNLPRCMDMITAEEVIRRIELYYQGGRLHYLTPAQRTPAEKGIAATRNNPFNRLPLNIHEAGTACDAAIHRIPPWPGGFQGRGIVICGGGVRHFTNAWVCIHRLRASGCRLPLELWFFGRKEMDMQMEALMARAGVRCIDAHAVMRRHPSRIRKGWGLKPYSMLHSAFKEILLLDADNVTLRNPEFLFDSPQFRQTGAIFWPDYRHLKKPETRIIWRSCGMRAPKEPEFETGQVLVHKERCWQALKLTLWFNENSDFYYQYVYGDKETFHLAFRKLKKSYSLVPWPIHPLKGTMCQHDFEGRRLFQHRNADKWDLFGDNKRVEDFWFEAECRVHLQNLREQWDGRIAGTRESVELNGSKKFIDLPRALPAPP
jgi:ADP-heptose:LPS heptosyltransferase